LDFWSFGFRDCLGFRNSDLGFNLINITFYKAKGYQYQANLSSIVVLKSHELTWRGLGLRPLAATKKIKIGSCESGELFFAFAFLFAAWPSCEGGEKRTTAKNKRPKVLF